eukprot:scaffold267064_cov32-Tisochrysis_lutea.AAC.1
MGRAVRQQSLRCSLNACADAVEDGSVIFAPKSCNNQCSTANILCIIESVEHLGLIGTPCAMCNIMRCQCRPMSRVLLLPPTIVDTIGAWSARRSPPPLLSRRSGREPRRVRLHPLIDSKTELGWVATKRGFFVVGVKNDPLVVHTKKDPAGGRRACVCTFRLMSNNAHAVRNSRFLFFADRRGCTFNVCFGPIVDDVGVQSGVFVILCTALRLRVTCCPSSTPVVADGSE